MGKEVFLRVTGVRVAPDAPRPLATRRPRPRAGVRASPPDGTRTRRVAPSHPATGALQQRQQLVRLHRGGRSANASSAGASQHRFGRARDACHRRASAIAADRRTSRAPRPRRRHFHGSVRVTARMRALRSRAARGKHRRRGTRTRQARRIGGDPPAAVAPLPRRAQEQHRTTTTLAVQPRASRHRHAQTAAFGRLRTSVASATARPHGEPATRLTSGVTTSGRHEQRRERRSRTPRASTSDTDPRAARCTPPQHRERAPRSRAARYLTRQQQAVHPRARLPPPEASRRGHGGQPRSRRTAAAR